MNLDKLPIDLLSKFLKGECTLPEKEVVLRYLKESENEEVVSALMEDAWNQSASKSSPILNSERSNVRYRKIRQRIRPVKSISVGYTLLRVAASLVLLFMVVVTGYQYRNTILNYIDPIAYIQIQSQPGQQTQLHLPDGSIVWLNASTTLIYPEKFRGETREITLNGEGFFKVKRDVSKPFIVHTGNLFTKVLGTSFNVKAYPSDKEIQVTVATGKVAVGLILDSVVLKQKQLALLSPRQQAIYSKVNHSFSKKNEVALAPTVGWTTGKLVFKNAPFAEMISTLQRWFGVSIQVERDEVKGCTFTADFKQRTPLRDVLEVLSMTKRLKYDMKNGFVKIYDLKCEN